MTLQTVSERLQATKILTDTACKLFGIDNLIWIATQNPEVAEEQFPKDGEGYYFLAMSSDRVAVFIDDTVKNMDPALSVWFDDLEFWREISDEYSKLLNDVKGLLDKDYLGRKYNPVRHYFETEVVEALVEQIAILDCIADYTDLKGGLEFELAGTVARKGVEVELALADAWPAAQESASQLVHLLSNQHQATLISQQMLDINDIFQRLPEDAKYEAYIAREWFRKTAIPEAKFPQVDTYLLGYEKNEKPDDDHHIGD